MLSEKENFDAQQSLQLIDEMINKAKNRFSEDGFLYLLWGWLVFACTVIQFILLQIHFNQHYLVWLLTWPAAIYQIFYLRKKTRNRSAKLYTDKIIGFVWITFFILMVLIISITSRGNSNKEELYQQIVNPCILALYGMPVFLSGIILRFAPLVAGAIGCWILSILAPYIPYDYQLLLVAIAMLIAWIIPGYLLRSRYRKTFA